MRIALSHVPRSKPLRRLTFNARAGINVKRFAGRGDGTRLRPGRYRVRVIARTGENTSTHQVTLTVAR